MLVHRYLDNRSILITEGGAERLPGSQHRFSNGMTLKVKSFSTNGEPKFNSSVAKVELDGPKLSV